MHEGFKLAERMSLPVEKEVWGMFTRVFRQGYTPELIVFVGDDGHGTLADLAAESFPESSISIIDRDPHTIRRLSPIAERRGWKVELRDITSTQTDIRGDAVFMKHGVHLNLPTGQEKIVASLFRLARRDGIVGWSVPTFLVGSLVRPQEAFTDAIVTNGFFHSSVFVGRNTAERQHQALQIAGGSG